MMILGSGGTGKSSVIGAITETFGYHDSAERLALCGTTGIASSNIGGYTLHSWAGLRRSANTGKWMEKTSERTKKKRRKNIQGKDFVIIDEISMANKVTFWCLSEILGEVRAEAGKGELHAPFGGMHIIICGDFHQFPPVGNPTGALYCERANDSCEAVFGRSIYQQFETVVMLTKQLRIKDEVWLNILDRLRIGECTESDLREIRKLIVNKHSKSVTDFTKDPWKDAILVTPRHAVRDRWNTECVRRHCAATGERMYICGAEDTDGANDSELPTEVRFEIARLVERQTGNLQDRTTVSIGMKAMVVINVATEADIANGTRGTIHDIILDPRETPTQGEDGTTVLKYPPAIIFKPNGKCNVKFDGLDEGLVPILPSKTTFSVVVKNRTHNITRRQLALTPGYAFTDYKAQAQTIENVWIDIGQPPRGSLSPFNAYVALSRSRGRETIRLLRDFDDDLFIHHPSEDLRREMSRLEELDKKTQIKFEALRN